MALTLDSSLVTPAELTGYVRAALADLPQNQFSLSEFLPDTPVDDIDFRVDAGGGGLAKQASFRAYDAESPISGRKGISRLSGQLPPISEKRRLGEYDRLKMRKLDPAIRDAILNDGVELARNIQARAEVARGQALMDGKVTIAENGLTLEADFGRKASHSQTAATLWSDPASKPIDDLLAWQDIYSGTNGVDPAQTIISKQVRAVLMRNAQIRSMVLAPGSTSQIVTADQLNALLESFGIATLRTYTAQVENAAGAAVPVLDPSKVLFVPPPGSKIGETLWGTTAEALDADYGIDAQEAPGIVVGSYSDKDPVGLWTKASAILLPTAAGTNYTLAAKVI